MIDPKCLFQPRMPLEKARSGVMWGTHALLGAPAGASIGKKDDRKRNTGADSALKSAGMLKIRKVLKHGEGKSQF